MRNVICEAFSPIYEGDYAAWLSMFPYNPDYSERMSEGSRSTLRFKYWLENIFNKSDNYHLFIITKIQMGLWKYCLRTYKLENNIYYKSRSPVVNTVHQEKGPCLTMFILHKDFNNA